MMRKKLFTFFLAMVTSVGTLFAESGTCGPNLTWDLTDGVLTISGTGAMTDYRYYGDAPWRSSTIKTIKFPNGLTSIGNYAFAGCSGLTSMTNIPNSVLNIGEGAFVSCSGLTSLTIPESVIDIADGAFRDCTSLTSVTIPNSVTSIGSTAFYNCSGLTSVTIPNSVTSIGSSAFYGCSSLTSVTIPNSVTSIGKDAFYKVPNIVYNGTASGSPWGARSVNGFVDGFLVYADAKKTNLIACSKVAEGEIVIPSSVTSIGSNAFQYCTGLTSVTIPNSVTSIGDYAFYGCTGLTSVTIPNSVTSIGDYAFSRCTGLTSVTIGNSVTSIGSNAFQYCTGLTSVTIPNSVTSIGNYAFNNVPNIVYNGTATGSPWGARSVNGFVEEYLVYGDASKTTLLACLTATKGDIIIPNSVTSIESWAFSGCSGLTSITIPNSVISIGSSAFSGCSGLKFVNVSDISAWCAIKFDDNMSNPLYQANNLYLNGTLVTNLVIPNSVTSIGDYAFYGCTGLTSVTIPNSVISIGSSAFRSCTRLTSVIIGNSVTSIGNNAFYECSSLTSVTIPNSVTSIGYDAFRDVLNIVYNGTATGSPWGAEYMNGFVDGYLVFADAQKTSLIRCSKAAQGEIVIPNSVTSIGDYAFSHCTGLTSVTIGNSVTSIGNNAFSYCTGLTSVTIPNSVTSIGIHAFLYCSSLTSVNIPNSVTSIGEYAFSNCSGLTSITIPNSVISIGSSAFRSCTRLTSVIIGNSVTSIGDDAFYECSSLTSVIIGNNVTSIGKDAFYDCRSLISVKIPNSVTSIGERAFYGCIRLTSVIIGNSVTSIGETAFYECRSLTSVTIPNSVTSIGNYAFSRCNSLEYVISLPNTPPTISSSIFPANMIVYVPNASLNSYKSATNWKNLNIKGLCNAEISNAPTSASLDFSHILWTLEQNYISSCGIEGGEQQPGNVLEYIGLEPNSEYTDIPVVLTANTGETETVNISFTTTALELTTKPSKPVSSNTAILLAETNMSDAEISCGFEWKRNDAPADMDGNKVYCPVASGQMAGRLKNLKDDVYYKYRAFYQSSAGNMYYGDWQYIFTGDVAVEFDPILYTYGATVVRENEATISGYALAGSEDFTEQGFEYWAESRTNSGANAPHRVPAALNEHFFVQASGIALHATLTNLDAGTVYKYRVYGKVGDQYYYGAEQSFATQGEYEGDDSEAIEEVPSDQVPSTKAQKILRNGQIFILRGEKVYTLTGQEVK